MAARPGITRRTLAVGPNIMMCEFILEAGAEIPEHRRPLKQVGYIVRGCIRLVVGGTAHEPAARDSYGGPGNIPHAAVAIEPTVVLDVFYRCGRSTRRWTTAAIQLGKRPARSGLSLFFALF